MALRRLAPLSFGTSRYASTAAGKKIAVVLSGCGVYDGAEATEAVATLVHLSRAGAEVSCYAPDKPQFHVIDHTKGAPIEEGRNVMTESARISRGAISPLGELREEEFAALVIPGGFGAAKNLCNHATVAQGDASKLEVCPTPSVAVPFLCILYHPHLHLRDRCIG